MDMNDIKDWAGRASSSGPPLTPDEGGGAPPAETPPADPHECSTALKSLGESVKLMATDLKTAKDKAASEFPDVDLKALDDLVAALETGATDLEEASEEVMEAEEEAEGEEDEEDAAEDDEDEDEDGPPGLA